MIVVDLNVLIYAVNANAEHHAAVARWWQSAMDGDEPIGISWIVISGFLRITTRRGALSRPLTIRDALKVVDEWLQCEQIVIIRETADHWTVLQRLLRNAGTGGNLVSDAQIAALTLCHGATLATCDSDFARFQGLRWMSPLRP